MQVASLLAVGLLASMPFASEKSLKAAKAHVLMELFQPI